MYKKIRIFLSLSLCFVVHLGYSQLDNREAGQFMDYNTVSMPESPTAKAFNEVGNIQVNTAIGVPEIRIPLYTYELDGVKIPITLAYDASGIKVSQMATSVGLGWSLDAGGQISRTVRSRPDEEEGRGWYDDGYIRESYYVGKDQNNLRWQQEMKGHFIHQYKDGLVGWSDHNPDLFSYSFLGNSGSYIHDTERNIIKEQNDGIYIEPFAFFNQDLEAVDLEGNYYFFDYEDTERSSNTNTFHSEVDLSLDFYEWEGQNGYDWITAWKLSRITTKNNKEILFKYESGDMEYKMRRENWQVTVGRTCGDNPSDIKSSNGTTVDYKYNTQLIKEIFSPDQNVKVKFEYASDTGLPDTVWSTKLSKITVSDSTTLRKKEFHFVYDRFDGDPRLKLTGVYEVGFDDENNMIQKPPFEFQYQNGSLPPKGSFAQDLYGYYNLALGNQGLIPQMTAQYFQGYFDGRAGNRSPNTNALKIGVLKQINYPTGGSTLFDYEPNVDDLSDNSGYRGGLRVKEVLDKDEYGEEFNRKTYNYSNLKGWDLQADIHQWFSKSEGPSRTYSSSPIRLPGDIGTGYKTNYFYGKVKVISHTGVPLKTHRVEYEYEENFYNLQKFDYVLSVQTTFLGSSEVKRVEFINGLISETDLAKIFEWHVVGDMVCFQPPTSTQSAIGYPTTPRTIQYSGNYAYLPTRIATTEFLGPNHNKPVTVLKDIVYDPETLLKTKEIIDMRYTRTGANQYFLNDAQAEQITVDYTYPFNSGHGFANTFPKGTVVKQEVTTKKGAVTARTSGRAFEFDGVGNIKRIYAHSKGAGSNTSPLSYIPNDYEQLTSFLFSNGKPVQVQELQGVPTTYIWSNKGELPLAKIEGVFRGAIDSGLLSQVENANYNDLPGRLNSLRAHASVKPGMVTTFTHKPLAGVETITDPKGDVQYFEYDSFGRLVQVKDKQGNILSENEYNYGF